MFWSQFVSPLIVSIISLLVEYGIIQPRYHRMIQNLPKQSRRDWITATIKALKKFQKELNRSQGIAKRRNVVLLEEEVKKGNAELIVGISEGVAIWRRILFGAPRVVQKVWMVIDRTGDILKIRYLPLELTEEPVVIVKEGVSRQTGENLHPNPYAVYFYILIFVLGAISGFISSSWLYWVIFQTSSPEDYASYWVTAIIGMLLGGSGALLVDRSFEMDRARVWQRLPVAIMLGLLAGTVGLLVVCIAICVIFLVWLLSQDSLWEGAREYPPYDDSRKT